MSAMGLNLQEEAKVEKRDKELRISSQSTSNMIGDFAKAKGFNT